MSNPPDEMGGPDVGLIPDIPDTYAAALRFMVNKPFLRTPRYRAQQWRANRVGAHPKILDFENMMITRFRKLGVPMFAHCVVRDGKTQNRLFVTGKTKARAGESPHNVGCAVDIVHGLRAWEVPKNCWDLIGHVGKEVAKSLQIKVVWGGDWRFYDPAHWELEDWKSLSRDLPTGEPVSPLDEAKKLYGL